MIQLVFEKFDELGSAYAVFRYLVAQRPASWDSAASVAVASGSWNGGRRRPLGSSRSCDTRSTRAPTLMGYTAQGRRTPRRGEPEAASGSCRPRRWPCSCTAGCPRTSRGITTWRTRRSFSQNRSLRESRGVPKRGEALLPGLVVCGKCGHRMTTRYKTDKRPSYYCGEYWRLALDEPCGHIAAAVAGRPGRPGGAPALEPAALELSLRAIENVEHERKRLHDHWRQTLERAEQEAAQAERQYQAVEPENRLVARTLESRWEEALKSQRQVEEDYHRFLAKLPPTLSAADMEKIRSLSGSVATLWHAPATSAADRKQIVRCLVERVIVVTDKSSELNDVTIVWQGGFETRHQVARPVGNLCTTERLSLLDGTCRASCTGKGFTSHKSPRGSTPRASSRRAAAAASPRRGSAS